MTEIALLTRGQSNVKCPECGRVLQGIDHVNSRLLIDIHMSVHAGRRKKTHEAELNKVRIAAKRAVELTKSRAMNS